MTQSRLLRLWALLLALAACCAGILLSRPLSAQPAMLSPQVRLSEKRAYFDQAPIVASNGRDRVAIAWCRSSPVADSSPWVVRLYQVSLWMRVLDESGSPLGPERRVAEGEESLDCPATIAMDASGGFVIAWSRALPDPYNDYAVRWLARRFDRDGRPLTGERRLDGRRHYYLPPQIVMDAEGRFTIGWIESRPSPDFTSVVWLQRFDPGLNPLGPRFELEPERPNSAWQLSLAMSPAGRLLVAWRTARSEDPHDGIALRLLDSDGGRLGERSFASSLASLGDGWPTAIADPSGGFWVAWHTDDLHIQGRRIDAEGHPVGEIFDATRGPMNNIALPNLVPYEGGLLVLWPGIAAEYVGQTFLQAVDAGGARRGPVVPLVSEGKRVAGFVGAASLSGDRVALVWEGFYPRPPAWYDFTEIVAQTFRLPPAGDEPCFLQAGSFSCDTLHDGGRPELIAPLEKDRFDPEPPPGLPLLGDLDGDGRDELCLVDLPFFHCDLDDNLQLAEEPLVFGAKGDTPLLGDVNGDGRDDLCVARADGFHCDTAHNGGSAEVRIAFGGQPGSIPLLGDVDGDGDDDPCVYLQSGGEGRLFCDTAHDGLVAEFAESFGSGAGTPFLADLDSDRRDELCVRQGHAFLCDTGHDGGAAERILAFDRASGIPFFGNADGF